MKLLTLLLILVIIPLVVAIPEIPHQFYGTVSNANGLVSSGTLTAKLAGKTFTIQIVNGNYGLSQPFLVHREDSTATNIEFYVDGHKAYDFTYEAGAYTQLNLNIPVFTIQSTNNTSNNGTNNEDDEEEDDNNDDSDNEDIIVISPTPQDNTPINPQSTDTNEKTAEESAFKDFFNDLIGVTANVITTPFKTVKNQIITSLVLGLLVISLYFLARKKL